MRYTFGDYVLDTQRADLYGSWTPIKLRRKVLQVLAYLLAHHDRVVPKQELLEQLWPEQFVGDETLKSCLKTLRQVLADRLGLATFQHLVQTFHALAGACVQRYEGSVQPLGEEGVLALFGVPVSQEEHAWRAVRAALELLQQLREASPRGTLLPGEALTARVGVHTGWVVAGSPSDAPQQSMIVGGDTAQGALSPGPRHPVCQDGPASTGLRRVVCGHRAVPCHGDDLLAAPGGGGIGPGHLKPRSRGSRVWQDPCCLVTIAPRPVGLITRTAVPLSGSVPARGRVTVGQGFCGPQAMGTRTPPGGGLTEGEYAMLLCSPRLPAP